MNAPVVSIQEWASAWTPALINHLWQSTLVTLMAALLAFALRSNHARTRFWIWMVASFKFLIPFSVLVTAGQALRSTITPSMEKPQLATMMERITQPYLQAEPDAGMTQAGNISAVAHGASSIFPVILAAIWLCGVLVLIFLWVRRWLQLRRLLRSATKVALCAEVPIMSVPGQLEPGIFGILRPVLMLPEGILEHLPAEQLGAIIAHEMTHVRRRDNQMAAIHMLVETVFWFHPAVWWIKAHLMEERERACDDAVLEAGNNADLYAESILNVCKFYLESPMVCMSGVTGSDLKKRIVRIMTQQTTRKLDLSRKLLLALTGSAAVLVPVSAGLLHTRQVRAQSITATDWQARAGGTRAFDVVSIRPNKTGTIVEPTFPLSADDSYRENGGNFRAGFPLPTYIEFAYKMQLTDEQRQSLLARMPKWAGTEIFVIEARAPGNPTKDQMRLMMQAVLADRFHLAFHFETKPTPVFAMVLEKPGVTGPKLFPHAQGAPCPAAEVDLRDQRAIAALGTTWPPMCSMYALKRINNGPMLLGSRNTSMELVAQSLPTVGRLGRPVVDQTGLTGRFDFTLEWVPDADGSAEPDPDQLEKAGGATFFEALKNQLGVKLKPATVPIQFPVIDHVDLPTAN